MQPGHSYISDVGDEVIRVLAQNSVAFVCKSIRVYRDRIYCEIEEREDDDTLFEISESDFDRINTHCKEIFSALDRMRLALVKNTGPITPGTVFANGYGINKVVSETEKEYPNIPIRYSYYKGNITSGKQVVVPERIDLISKKSLLRDYTSCSDPENAFDRFRKIFRLANTALMTLMDDLYNRYVPQE